MKDPAPREADLVARRVLRTRLAVKPGENVTIEAYPSSLSWAAGFVREARRAGAHPLLHYEDERSYWSAVAEGRSEIIGTPGSHEWAALAETDIYIYFWGPEDQVRMGRLPDGTTDKLTAFNSKWYQVAARSGLRGVRMGIARVTEPNARHWGVSPAAWRKELVNATKADPHLFVADSEKLRRAFERGHMARVRHSNGTDLTIGLSARKAMIPLGWVTSNAMRKRSGSMANVPDGSVYVASNESTADGTLVANRMSGMFGDPIRGGRWTFRDGRLVGQKYTSGGPSVWRAYSGGGKGRDLPAMLEVGLDPNIHISPNLEENELGAVSIGIGSNAGFGGKTRSRFVAHLTVAGASLTIDDRLVVKGGHIV